MENYSATYDFFDYTLQSPFSYSIFGGSQSGKSYFIRELLKSKDYIIDRPTSGVTYFYQTWQREFDDLIKLYGSGIDFVQGIISTKWIEDNMTLPPSDSVGRHQCPLIICDDGGALINGDTQKVFEVYVHHYFFNLVYSFHSLFSTKREHRAISLNSTYIHIQRNTRDLSWVSALSTQVEGPQNRKRLMSIYADATLNPYTYLMIDLHQTCPKSRQLRSNILFEGNNPLIIYERA